MATYKNSYTQQEDTLLWELHNIRHQQAEKNRSFDSINQSALTIIKQYNLKKLKMVSHPTKTQ